MYILFSLGRKKNLQIGQFCFLVFWLISILHVFAGFFFFFKDYLEIQAHWKIAELTHKTNVETFSFREYAFVL